MHTKTLYTQTTITTQEPIYYLIMNPHSLPRGTSLPQSLLPIDYDTYFMYTLKKLNASIAINGILTITSHLQRNGHGLPDSNSLVLLSCEHLRQDFHHQYRFQTFEEVETAVEVKLQECVEPGKAAEAPEAAKLHEDLDLVEDGDLVKAVYWHCFQQSFFDFQLRCSLLSVIGFLPTRQKILK